MCQSNVSLHFLRIVTPPKRYTAFHAGRTRTLHIICAVSNKNGLFRIASHLLETFEHFVWRRFGVRHIVRANDGIKKRTQPQRLYTVSILRTIA